MPEILLTGDGVFVREVLDPERNVVVQLVQAGALPLGGRSPILHRDLLRVTDVPHGPALHAVCLHHDLFLQSKVALASLSAICPTPNSIPACDHVRASARLEHLTTLPPLYLERRPVALHLMSS